MCRRPGRRAAHRTDRRSVAVGRPAHRRSIDQLASVARARSFACPTAQGQAVPAHCFRSRSSRYRRLGTCLHRRRRSRSGRSCRHPLPPPSAQPQLFVDLLQPFLEPLALPITLGIGGVQVPRDDPHLAPELPIRQRAKVGVATSQPRRLVKRARSETVRRSREQFVERSRCVRGILFRAPDDSRPVAIASRLDTRRGVVAHRAPPSSSAGNSGGYARTARQKERHAASCSGESSCAGTSRTVTYRLSCAACRRARADARAARRRAAVRRSSRTITATRPSREPVVQGVVAEGSVLALFRLAAGHPGITQSIRALRTYVKPVCARDARRRSRARARAGPGRECFGVRGSKIPLSADDTRRRRRSLPARAQVRRVSARPNV
jgi:hypothetical protein